MFARPLLSHIEIILHFPLFKPWHVFSKHKIGILSFRTVCRVYHYLEQKLFKFEILQFLNLAYFLHIKANFKRKCLNTIENHAFSNEH